MAYAQVATRVTINRGPRKIPPSDGKPMSTKATKNLILAKPETRTYASQGSDKTQTDGSILKMVYQKTVATTKMEQTIYRSTSLSVFDPPSKLNWKDVYWSAWFYWRGKILTADMSWPKAIMIVYNGQPAILCCMNTCSRVMRASSVGPSSYISLPP